MVQVEMVEMEVEITPPEQMNVDVTVQSMDVDISAETMTGTVIQGIDEIKDKIDNIKLPDIDLTPVAKEATLLAKVAELKEALNTIDFTAIEQAIQNVEDVTAREATLIQGVGDIIKAVENIDFTNLENSIAEVKDAVVNIDFSTIAKETTLNSAKEEILTAVENAKPEIDTTELAKQGENPEATLSAVLEGFTSLDSLIRESVLKENVIIKLTADTAVNWTDYIVSVTIDDIVSAISITDNGDCAFSVPIGKNYSVQLPVIGAYIAPEKQSFIAVTTNRVVNFNYISIGVFGMDELGKRYSKEEIELLTDKSIIKYCGYADDHLANSLRVDGSIGNVFVWEIDSEFAEEEMQFASANVEFSQELLPLISNIDANQYCDGVAYTNYILSEGIRLKVDTPAASYAISQKIKCGKAELQGHLPSPGEALAMFNNATLISDVYNILGKTSPWGKDKGYFMISMQGVLASYQAYAIHDYQGIGFKSTYKKTTRPVCVVYRV